MNSTILINLLSLMDNKECDLYIFYLYARNATKKNISFFARWHFFFKLLLLNIF